MFNKVNTFLVILFSISFIITLIYIKHYNKYSIEIEYITLKDPLMFLGAIDVWKNPIVDWPTTFTWHPFLTGFKDFNFHSPNRLCTGIISCSSSSSLEFSLKIFYNKLKIFKYFFNFSNILLEINCYFLFFLVQALYWNKYFKTRFIAHLKN